MSNYTTGEIAKRCGVSVRTVQYYSVKGILTPTDLTEGGRRLYSEDDCKKLKIVCFLRELDLSLDKIGKLMREANSEEVIALILEEQRCQLAEELGEKREKLERLQELQRLLGKSERFSVESIGDAAHRMENKKKMKKLRRTLLLTGIPMTLAEWGTVLLWIFTGIWLPFAVYTVAIVPYALWVSRYYFTRVAYICPQCHQIFVPSMKQAFWASHTPTMRKLSCPYCGYHGFCVETYRREERTDGNADGHRSA